MMMYEYAAISDIGPQYEINDDRILIGDTIINSGEYSGKTCDEVILLAIADGVGGLQMGYAAAEETLKVLSSINHPDVDRMQIRNIVEVVNKSVLQKQRELNLLNGLRTTLAAIYLDAKSSYVFNAGDSRVYRFRNESIELLSKDHSVVQNLLDTGEITEEQAYSHPKRNVITKCIGDEERVNARIIDFSDDVKSGDIFLLCSDGISDCMRNDEMKEILMRDNTTLLEKCRSFIHKAIENGSTDNISICLMRKE